MIITNRLKNQHLLWRAAFGPMAEMSNEIDTFSQAKLWKLLVSSSAEKPGAIAVTALNLPDESPEKSAANEADKANKGRLFRIQSREDLQNMNLEWLSQMINSKAQLREKMAFFWHGHFACRIVNSPFQEQLLNIIRNNALGNFGTLLREVSKSPAMLQFLNNQQNRKAHPNENFAREVMELFTMGRGNYTEQDIKEAARAFTGWGFNLQAQFINRPRFHDDGSKTILGRSGNFNGDDVLDILLAQQQTAYFITKKIYKFFVNENIDEAKVQWLAKRFYANKYEVLPLLEDIFTGEWFYSEKNIGNKIKSPIELIVGLRRYMPMVLDKENSQLIYQRLLGQILFFPPNVAGWPGGKSWIDSSTLMVRLQMPKVFTANETVNISPKSDDDLNMGMMEEATLKIKRKMMAAAGGGGEIDWESVSKAFEKTKREELLSKISDSLLQTGSRIKTELLLQYIDQSSRENYIKSAVINLMSTPEYQLC